MNSDENLRRCWGNLLVRSTEFARKIAPLFQANNWRYAEAEGVVVPNAERLEQVIYSLAWDAYKHAPDCVSSGRLAVRFWKSSDGRWRGKISLEPEKVETSQDE